MKREPEGPDPAVPGRSAAATERRTRRAYAAPRILSREPLEAVAAVCGPPGKSNPGLCPSGPISS